MTGKIITFYIEKILFGIDITSVKEVGRKAKYTPVPGTKPCIAGLMNMRGQVITLFDINRVMGFEHGNSKTDSSYIILKTCHGSNGYAGFLVDKLEDVLDVHEEWCEAPPENMEGPLKNSIKELARLKDGIAAVIDCDRILRECTCK